MPVRQMPGSNCCWQGGNAQEGHLRDKSVVDSIAELPGGEEEGALQGGARGRQG